MNNIFLNEHRCQCGKLLLKGVFFDASLEIKCKKCGLINKIGETKLIDDVSHYFFNINREGVFTNVSDSACSILEYSRDEIIGKHFNFIDPTVPKEFPERFFSSDALLNGDDYFQLETNHIPKSGDPLPVKVLLKVQKINNKEKNVLLLAELKKKEEIKHSKKELELSKNISDFYFDIDKNSIITYVSPSVEKIFDISQLELVGKSCFSFVSGKLRKEAEENFKFFSTRGEPYQRENDKGCLINNKIVRYKMYFTPKLNDMGNFVGYRVLAWLKKK